jgi:hypothetical protein
MMVSVSGIANCKLRLTLFALTVVFVAWMASPGDSQARQKRPAIYNQCVCACYTPASGFGTILDGIQNTAGVSCEVYNNRPCTGTDENGATISGTTKYCGGYKPGGTKAMLSAIPNMTLSIAGRGVEEDPKTSAGRENESAVLTSQPGNVMMNCSCAGGSGSCSVTSTDGKTSTCHKGDGDTCSGSCSYPKGTISGAE